MNIAMFTNNYLPFVGGVPISIDRLANSLRQLGHNVYIFAPSYDNFDTDTDYVIRCASFKNSKVSHYISRLTKKENSKEFIMPNIFDITTEEKFKSLNIDVIHIHHTFLMGEVGHYLAEKYSIPLVLTFHTMLNKYLHNIPLYKHLYKLENHRDVNTLIRFTENYIVPKYIETFGNKCNVVISPTECTKEYLRSLHLTTDIEVLPTGLLEESFNFNTDTVDDIIKTYKKDKKYLFCSVSRISKEKNIEFLINGLKVLKDKIGDNFNCIIIGKGPLETKLKEVILELGLGDNVFLLGSIDNSKLNNYYKASDLFLFASQSETQGIVLLEAMSAETPVVAVEGPGINDLIEDGINGYKTKANLNDWTNNIVKITSDYSVFNSCKINALNTALKYKQSSIAKHMSSIYLDAINKLNKESCNEFNHLDCRLHVK